MDKSLVYIAGMAVGICVVLIVCYLTSLLARKSGNKFSGKIVYDERQMIARGVAYKWGLISMSISIMGVSWLAENENLSSLHSMQGAYLQMIIGFTVFASICIWKEAYISITENYKSTIFSLAAISALNFVCYFGNSCGGKVNSFNDFMSNIKAVNLISAIAIIVILIQVIIKMAVNNMGGDAGEES